MRLSTKLKISFGFLIILPVALFGTVLFSITKIQLHRIQEKYGIQNISYDALMNPVLLSNEMCRQEYEEIRQTAEDNPSKLRDLNYLNAINNRISKRNAYIVVIEDNDIMYQGKEISDELRAKLIESQNHNSEIRSAYLRDFNVLASRVSYIIDSHTYGTVYFVISFAEILPQIKKLLFDTMILSGLDAVTLSITFLNAIVSISLLLIVLLILSALTQQCLHFTGIPVFW